MREKTAVLCAGVAVIIAVLAVFVVVLAALVGAQEVRVREIRKEAGRDVANANRTAQMLLALLNKPADSSPEALIAAVGTTVNKILAGQPMQVNENVQETKEEEQPYYPDVEFDEWLGAEGMPIAAGWWSPPKNDEPTENVD